MWHKLLIIVVVAAALLPCRADDLSAPARVQALIQALASDDNALADRVQEELADAGEPAAKALHEALKRADKRLRERIEETLAEIGERALEKDFEQLAAGDDAQVDLLRGALLVARTQFPLLDEKKTRRRVEKMAEEIKAKLDADATAKQKLAALMDYLFVQQGFAGDERDFYHPRNSCLNDVLERHTGLPITLSVLTMEVSRRLGLRVAGVGLPGHFIVKAEVDGETFFLDPFHGGQALTRADCQKIAADNGQELTNELLQPVPNREILVRMLRNLLAVAIATESAHQARQLQRYIEVLSPAIRRRAAGSDI